jgi:PAS domain S-box-containing protein
MNDADKTREQLIEELNLLRTLINALPDRLYVKDAKSRFVICNKAVAEDTDLPLSGSPIGKSDFDLFGPELAGTFYAAEQEIIKTGKPMMNEEVYRTRRKDGQENWSLCTKLPWRDNEGRIIGIIGSNRDITEQKKAEQALRESEVRYKAIFEAAREGIVAADIKTKRFKYANPAICEMLGYTAEEMQKMSINDIHPKEFLPHVISEFEAQARGEKTLACNIPCLRRDGTVFFADINTTNVMIDKRPCNVGFFTDITERKQAEEALRESEQKYRLLIEQLPAITYTAALDEKSTTLYISPQVQEILGVSQEDYKADPDLWRKMLHPDDRDRVLAELAASHQTGKLFSSEYRMVAKGGRIVWIRDDARIVEDSEGKPLYLQGVMYDITERKKAEEQLQKAREELETRVRQRTAELAQAVEELQKEIAERRQAEELLRKAEERFRTVFENTIVGLYRTTPDGRILLANPALVKMMGCQSLEELAQMNLEKEGFDPSTPRSIFKERIEKEGKVIGLESVWLRPDGTKLFVSESAFAVKDENGNTLYYEGTAQDISKRKDAEEKLLHYQQQLRSLASQLSLAEERLRRRIATELHDHISQNLAISKMKLDALADSSKPETAVQLKEVTGLIAQTIDVTRSLTFEMSPPVLYELGFEAAVGWLTKQTRQQFGLEVEFIDDGKPKPLTTDIRVLLFQAVRELLVNVVKHARTDKAKITSRKGRGCVRIIVEDNGVGFDTSSISTRDYTKGGFGLFNIRERLDHIGGSVNIRSRPGHGARVTLIVPINTKTKRKME